MIRLAAYGVGQGLDGREAAMKATQKALDQLGALRPALAIAFVSEEFDVAQAVSGLSSLLGDTPLWGLSSVCPMTGDGEQPRSVAVALLAGNDLKAQAHWWSTFATDSVDTARQVMRALRSELLLPQAVLVAADGVNGNLLPVCQALNSLPSSIAGCMASGGYSSGKTYLFAKSFSGHSSMATAALGGRFRISTGVAHGWHDTGIHFTATKAHDIWVQHADGQSAVEMYSRHFGHKPREWAYPPLNDLVRLYPLGLERPGEDQLLLRSPLRVEVDGSLRMSAMVPEGSVAHLMFGDTEACLKAITSAVQDALNNLEPAKPLIALAFVDLSWQFLFGSQSGQVPEAIQEVLGSIPLVGGYTLGQIARPALLAEPQIYNQSVEIVLIGYQE
jgi:hypothetical protein